MKKHVISLLTLVLLLPNTQSHAGGWQEPTKVAQYLIEGSGAGERIYVQFENDFNPDTCTGKGTEWARIYGDTTKGKYMLSSIISAKAAAQTVLPLIYGCDDWGRPRLMGLMVQ